MEERITRQIEYGTYAFWLALMALLLLGTACGPKAYPSGRPKFGDSTAPVGPSKSHYHSQPKFKP